MSRSRRSEDRDAAFTAFVAARRTHLRRIAYATCGDWHRADDLVQTALVKAYVAWPTLRNEGSEEAFVRRIIVRSNVDESRRPWRHERSGLEGHDRATAAPDVEERSALFDALQDLPVMQRKAVLLRHWVGLSTAETAVELGISEGTVKSHCSRGRARLQRLLADPAPTT